MAANTMFVTVGKQLVADYIHAGSACFIGWGDSATDPVAGDVGLNNALTESRVSAAESQPTATTCRWVGTITCTTPATVREVGLFDGAGAGNPPSGAVLILHSNNFTAIPVLATDTIEFTLDLVIT